MSLALKEMKRNKGRFFIVGSIVFLISFLTFMISGLANGLSQDNAALIKNMPDGYFYMMEEAEGVQNLSRIPENIVDETENKYEQATAMSIQMGFLNDVQDKQYGVAFVATSDSTLFPDVKAGEVIVDQSLEESGLKIGDVLTNNQMDGELVVKGFVEGEKYSHAPVAFVSQQDYGHMYRVRTQQMVFIPGDEVEVHKQLEALTAKDLLQGIASYKAEQLSLNMIVGFLIVISGLLFAIFFYMMNVQKMGIYGILKAIGLKTMKLFQIIWVQMFVVTIIALMISIILGQVFSMIAPSGMPFHLPFNTTIQLSIVFLIIGFIGATISGIQIKQIEPLQAIQKGDQ